MDRMKDFRWLHLSDLHFTIGTVHDTILRDRILGQINSVLNRNEINCLVLSGDIFHKSTLTTDSERILTNFINALPGAKEMIVICPGNHDLDRNARLSKGNPSSFSYRSKLLETNTYDIGRQELSASDYALLCDESFASFFSYMQKFDNVRKRSPLGSTTDRNSYEICIDTARKHPINFISLNTALFAGRPIRGENLCSKLQQLKEAINKSEGCHKYKEASAKFSKYAHYMDCALADDYVVDDSDLPVLTRKAEEVLLEHIMNDSHFSILVGHHGMGMISRSDRDRLFAILSRRTQPWVYLCGHSHIPQYKRHELDAHHYLHEFTAGGSFLDMSSYAKYSFDIGHVTFSVDDRVTEIEVTTHYCVQKPSSVPSWGHETEIVQLPNDYSSKDGSNATQYYQMNNGKPASDNSTKDGAASNNPELSGSTNNEKELPTFKALQPIDKQL